MNEQIEMFEKNAIDNYGLLILQTLDEMYSKWNFNEKDIEVKPYQRKDLKTGEKIITGYAFKPFNTVVFSCQEMKGLKKYRFEIKDLNYMEGDIESNETIRQKYEQLLIQNAEISDCPVPKGSNEELSISQFRAEIPLDNQRLRDFLMAIEPVIQSLYSWAREHEKVEPFASCSYYMVCSEIGKCVHEMTADEYGDGPKRFHMQEPDLKFAKRCQYRKNLRRGKNFYAKQR